MNERVVRTIVEHHVDGRHFEIRLSSTPDDLWGELRVSAEDGPSWTRTEVATWGGVKLGEGCCWTSRQLVVLPATRSGPPSVYEFDEDIRAAFVNHPGWIVICETSVIRLVAGAEIYRLDLGEILLAARRKGVDVEIDVYEGGTFRARADDDTLHFVVTPS